MDFIVAQVHEFQIFEIDTIIKTERFNVIVCHIYHFDCTGNGRYIWETLQVIVIEIDCKQGSAMLKVIIWNILQFGIGNCDYC